MALVQGGTFTGIVFTQSGFYALANSYLVWIGGWMGQYALALSALLIYRRVKPKSFLGRSALVVLVVQNLISEPPYIASLQGDSQYTLRVLKATGLGGLPSVAAMETIALVLGLIGIYGAWRIFRSYLSSLFNWIGGRRAGWASLLFVAGSAADYWFTNLVPRVPATVNLLRFPAEIGFLAVFSFLVIPPKPVGIQRIPDGGPTIATTVFIVLLFVEAQLVFFVLPLTIPFP